MELVLLRLELRLGAMERPSLAKLSAPELRTESSNDLVKVPVPVNVGDKKVIALRGPLKTEGDLKLPVLEVGVRSSDTDSVVTLEELRISAD